MSEQAQAPPPPTRSDPATPSIHDPASPSSDEPAQHDTSTGAAPPPLAIPPSSALANNSHVHTDQQQPVPPVSHSSHHQLEHTSLEHASPFAVTSARPHQHPPEASPTTSLTTSTSESKDAFKPDSDSNSVVPPNFPSESVDSEANLQTSKLDKGKGRAVELEDPTDSLPGKVEAFNLNPSSADSDFSTILDETTAPKPPAKPAPLNLQQQDEEEWALKEIAWPPLPPPPSAETGDESGQDPASLGAGPTIRIITQNRNGPCSLLALCNILILRGDILISPATRPSVSYSYLSSLLADYLLRVIPTSHPDVPELDFEAALEVLPTTRYGLSLNPRFGSIDGFRPAGGFTAVSPNPAAAAEAGNEGEMARRAQGTKTTGELALFSLTKIPLLHGWIVDPQDEETWEAVVGEAGDYDRAVEMVVEGEEISGGLDTSQKGEEEVLEAIRKRSLWTLEEERKVRRADIISSFLSTSSTQLTYHGLFLLSSHLAPNSLSALFRNSHLSVIYRRPVLPPSASSGPELFTLVTDSSFAGERGIVWESLEDVEGGASEFFDGALRRSQVRGGDWVGRGTGGRRGGEEGERRRMERDDREMEQVARMAGSGWGGDGAEDHDLALAQQLQLEEDEDAHYRELEAQRLRQQTHPPAEGRRQQPPPAQSRTRPQPAVQQTRIEPPSKGKKDKDKCLVM
ncbi:hypothetical protein T439DRAFT_345789 [Meredithblackwellia eburnea MCA 4105]